MKSYLFLLIAFLHGLGSLSGLAAQAGFFNYQGRLQANDTPVHGSYDFRFLLFADSSGGDPIEDAVTLPAVEVSNGLFNVELNFGQDVFSGQQRWLEISVRPASVGSFTTLSPRQPINPVPYALTALKVPGLTGNALHAPGQGPQNAVVVDESGLVGIGTSTPQSKLHIVAKPDEGPPRVQSSGNSLSFGSGWDFYHGGIGVGYVGVPDVNAGFAPGELVLFGGPNNKVSLWPGQNRALTADLAGNVGIGTATPNANPSLATEARLDVRGNIRLGTGGQFLAAAGQENLRIVRGVVNAEGTIVEGSGFGVTSPRNGHFDLQFNPPFAGAPALTATAEYATEQPFDVMVKSVTSSRARVVVYQGNTTIHFIAIGPR